MSRYSPLDCFRQKDDLRLRQVPEWGCMLIYTPSDPKVHYLDARSWLIFDLCDGRTYEELVTEFSEAAPAGTTSDQIRSAVGRTLESLLEKNIVARTAGPNGGRP